MAASSSLYTQRRYRQVPLYLQDVLEQASQYTREADNYNVLMNAALELDNVLFLTLNYDTLLDTRLAEYSPLTDMDWYTETDDRWALVKLHGSVNWGWRLPLLEQHSQLSRTSIESANIVADDYAQQGFPELDPGEIRLRTHDDLGTRRLDATANAAVYYPALAVPLGASDELVCPSSHLIAARKWLEDVDGVNLLVIGYSGVDQEVLRLFAESGNSIRRMLVANGEGMADPRPTASLTRSVKKTGPTTGRRGTDSALSSNQVTSTGG